MFRNLDHSIVKQLEEKELSSKYGCDCKETVIRNKMLPAEQVKVCTVKCSCYSNPATNWWLALIAFLLFLMLCTNSNFN